MKLTAVFAKLAAKSTIPRITVARFARNSHNEGLLLRLQTSSISSSIVRKLSYSMNTDNGNAVNYGWKTIHDEDIRTYATPAGEVV